MSPRWAGALLLVLSLLVLARTAHAQAPRPVHARRLGNGLRVVVCPDPGGVDVSVVVRYDVGSRDEPGGLEGLAHQVEHLMFAGSRHVAPGEHLRLLDRVGATNVNAETGADSTVYHETVPPERLELALWLESDRMAYPLERVDAARFVRERAVVLNEYRERVVDTVFGQAGAILHGELFPEWHPYHHVTTGNHASIVGIGLPDARAFARTWYGPANAMIVITGRVDPGTAMALAERYFGTIPPRPPPKRPALPELPPPEPTRLRLGAQVTRSEVHLAWITPRYGAPGDAELDLVAAVLAGQDAGWLQHALLGEKRAAVRVGARQSSMDMASIFTIRATVADGRSRDEVLASIDAVLARLPAITEADVARAKVAFINGQLFGLESSMTWALRLQSFAQIGPLPSSFNGRDARYERIAVADVVAAARRDLRSDRRVVLSAERMRGAPIAGVLRSREEVEP